ncbi:uncharacterized protein ACNLHF_007760 isoform 2-T2 [Anomaloglossus baeobatrachus]|uniref:natural cytotoxicity triggering receptor 3 ligand 1 isoform X2 n=1 Tax=Anomaloglossus baeobatrachus TaxID=238106 RepID=UPI003F50CD0E
MKGRINPLYILLISLVTTDGLKVAMKEPLISVLRGANVTIPCEISEFTPGKTITVSWSKSQNGINSDVYSFIPGRPQAFRQGCEMGEESAIQKGNAALHIPRAQFSDDGQYTCTVIVTPESSDGRSILQVSAAPSAVLTTGDTVSVELENEKVVSCEVSNFYPKNITIQWVRHDRDSKCVVLERETCTGDSVVNTDGTFSVTSHLTLYPALQDSGYRYSCLVKHRSLHQDLMKNFTLTVTEKEDNSGTIVGALVATILTMLLLLAGVLYYEAIKKDPPTISEIVGSEQLIDMTRTTLTFTVQNFKPNDLEICVCLTRRGEEAKRIHTWRSRAQTPPVRVMRDQDAGGASVNIDIEQQSLMNGAANHTQGPLHLEMTPVMTPNRSGLLRFIHWQRLCTFSCLCSVHITPSYSEDNGAELSVHVSHPALAEATSMTRTLRVTGVAPTLLKIVRPAHVAHEEQTMLTCPILGFKPRTLQVTWLKKDHSGREMELVTWNSTDGRSTNQIHDITEQEHEDKSYNILSALMIRPTIREDDGVSYVCKAYHPATEKWAEETVVLEVTVSAPQVSDIRCSPPSPDFGSLVTLSCDVSEMYPKDHKVQWYKSRTMVSPNVCTEPFQEDPESGTFRGTIALKFTADNTCHQENFRLALTHCGKTIERQIRLMLGASSGLPVLGDLISDPSSPRYGHPVTLRCQVTNSNPQDIEVTWLKGEKPLEKREGIQKQIPEKDGSISCSLQIMATALDCGKPYSCSVTHRSTNMTLKKSHYLPLPDKAPTFSDITVRPERLVAGKEATFTVMISGFTPEIRVKWYKDFNPFPSDFVTTRDPEVGADSLCRCSSSLRFTPQDGDHQASIRCEATHSVTKKVHEQLYRLHLSGRTSGERPPPATRPPRSVKTSGIQCLPEHPRVGDPVTLTCYVDGCDAEDSVFSWTKGMFPIEGDVQNTPDGSGSVSTVTFTAQETDRDCAITCEVTYNLQTREEYFTLKLQ